MPQQFLPIRRNRTFGLENRGAGRFWGLETGCDRGAGKDGGWGSGLAVGLQVPVLGARSYRPFPAHRLGQFAFGVPDSGSGNGCAGVGLKGR